MKSKNKTLNFKIKSFEENEDVGIARGLASVYNNTDSYNDIVVPGAFTKSLETNNFQVVALWQHDVEKPIGINYLKDTENGLETELHINKETQYGKEAYALLKQGAINGLSIGYKLLDYETVEENNKIKYLLKEIDLKEVSVVTFPANTEALVNDVKKEEIENNENKEEIEMNTNEYKEKMNELQEGIKGAASIEDVKSLELEVAKLKASQEAQVNAEVVATEEIKSAQAIEYKSGEELTGSIEYREAFKQYFKNSNELNVEQKSLLKKAADFWGVQAGAGSDASPIIPMTIANKIKTKLEEGLKLYNEVAKINIRGQYTISSGELTTDVIWGETAEGTAMPILQGNLTDVVLGSHKVIAGIKITREAYAMTIEDFENFLVNGLVKKIMRSIENGIATGTGVKQPKGLLTDASLTNVNTVASSTFKYKDINDILASLPNAEYETGAKFYMNRKTYYSIISNLRDNNNAPVIYEDLKAGSTLYLKGFPVVLSETIPAFGTPAAKTNGYILFGNLAEAYTLKIDEMLRIERDASVGFMEDVMTFKGVFMGDGAITNPDALVKVKDADAPTRASK